MKKFGSLPILITAAVVLGCGCKTPPPPFRPEPIPRSTDIDTNVHRLFHMEPALRSIRIEVNTFLGQVLLDGLVDTEQQRQRATQLAWGVYGVRAVENNIFLRSEKTTPEE